VIKLLFGKIVLKYEPGGWYWYFEFKEVLNNKVAQQWQKACFQEALESAKKIIKNSHGAKWGDEKIILIQ